MQLLNFNNSGNVAVLVQKYPAGIQTPERWSAYFMANKELSDRLNQKQKDRIMELGSLKEGKPTDQEIVSAVCDLIEKSRQPQNKDLGIEIAKMAVEPEWKDTLLWNLEEKFGLKPIEIPAGTEIKG